MCGAVRQVVDRYTWVVVYLDSGQYLLYAQHRRLLKEACCLPVYHRLPYAHQTVGEAEAAEEKPLSCEPSSPLRVCLVASLGQCL